MALLTNFQFTCQVPIWHAPSDMMHMRHSLCRNMNDAMFSGGDRWNVLFICTTCMFWCITLHLFQSTGIYAWDILCGRFTFRHLRVNDDIVSIQSLTWKFWKGVNFGGLMCWLCGLGRRRSSPPPYPSKPQPQQPITGGGGAPQAMAVGPYAGVDSHLRGLASAAEGFGHSSIGGLNGEVYHVTSLAGK